MGQPKSRFTAEALLNLQIAENLRLPMTEAPRKPGILSSFNCELFVDAVLGTGVRGVLRPPLAEVIHTLNALPIPILAVDIPSGLDTDTGHPLGTCVRADRTITIGLPKRGLLLQPGADLAGTLEIADIGFPKQVVAAQSIQVNWAAATHAAQWLPSRPPASHKGSYGRVLVVAGSTGMTGAAALASEAALRAGAGLVTLAIPGHLNPILEGLLPEAMTLPLPETDAGSLAVSGVSTLLTFAEATGAVLAIGPGLSQHVETVSLVHELVRENREQGLGLPMVIDADGLNALAQDKEIIATLEGNAVLTPHPGEMARLTDTAVAALEKDRIRTAQEFATAHTVTLVLKGAPTLTAAANGDVWVNSTGNPGMGTGGMGDVLTGIIAGLIAQGCPHETAAALGVYLHGMAADRAAESLGMHGLIASDLLRAVPETIAAIAGFEAVK